MPPGTLVGEEQLGVVACAVLFSNQKSRFFNLKLFPPPLAGETAVCAVPLGCYTVTCFGFQS